MRQPTRRKPYRQYIQEQLERDPDFAAVYEETKAEGRLARAIATFREQKGLSQRTLAEAAGMSQPMLARIERAAQNPTFATLEKLARALDATIEIDGNGVRLRPAVIEVSVQEFPQPPAPIFIDNIAISGVAAADRARLEASVTILGDRSVLWAMQQGHHATSPQYEGAKRVTPLAASLFLPLDDNMPWWPRRGVGLEQSC